MPGLTRSRLPLSGFTKPNSLRAKMTDLFSAKRPDGRAEWRVVYDAVMKLNYGDQITFKQLEDLIDTHDRNRIHRAVGRCNHVFTRENVPKVLGNIRGTGYRVLEPGDYAPQALNHQKQARRRMSSAVELMRTAPLNDMTPSQRHWAHQVTMVLVDNELRLRTQEQWKTSAEDRLRELEKRAGINIEPEIIAGEAS
jgi:hypothetical protein